MMTMMMMMMNEKAVECAQMCGKAVQLNAKGFKADWLLYVPHDLTLTVLCILPLWLSQSTVAVFVNRISRNSLLFVLHAGKAWLSTAWNPAAMAVVISGSHLNCAILSSISAADAVVCSRPAVYSPLWPRAACPLTRTASYWVWQQTLLGVCAVGSRPIRFVPLVPPICTCRILRDPPPPTPTAIFLWK